MRRSNALLFAFFIAGLSGCSERGPEAEPKAKPAPTYRFDPARAEMRAVIAPRGGEPVKIRSGPAVPPKLPPGFALLPGASILSSTIVERDGDRRVLVVSTTSASVAAVMRSYREQAIRAGAEVVLDLVGEERASLVGRLGSGKPLSISARREGGVTRVEFSHG